MVLLVSCDLSCVVEVYVGIYEHLCVAGEVFYIGVCEHLSDGCRKSADTELKCASALDPVYYELSDLLIVFVCFFARDLSK